MCGEGGQTELNAESLKLKRAAEKKVKRTNRSNKEKTESFKGKEEDRGAFGHCARGRAAGKRRSGEGKPQLNLLKKISPLRLLFDKALDPGRSSRGHNREQSCISAAAVAAEHGNIR